MERSFTFCSFSVFFFIMIIKFVRFINLCRPLCSRLYPQPQVDILFRPEAPDVECRRWAIDVEDQSAADRSVLAAVAHPLEAVDPLVAHPLSVEHPSAADQLAADLSRWHHRSIDVEAAEDLSATHCKLAAETTAAKTWNVKKMTTTLSSSTDHHYHVVVVVFSWGSKIKLASICCCCCFLTARILLCSLRRLNHHHFRTRA